MHYREDHRPACERCGARTEAERVALDSEGRLLCSGCAVEASARTADERMQKAVGRQTAKRLVMGTFLAMLTATILSVVFGMLALITYFAYLSVSH